MKKKSIIFGIALGLLIILILALIFWNRISPTYRGEFLIEEKTNRMKEYNRVAYSSGEVTTYFTAARVASNIAVQEGFSDYQWYSTDYLREVYCDKNAGYWFVYVHLNAVDVLDGCFCCIISFDGKEIYYYH